AATRSHLPELLHRLSVAEVLSPLDRLLKDEKTSDNQDEDFFIPRGQESPAADQNPQMPVVGQWLIRGSDELFPARSWPWQLAREAGFMLRGRGQYLDQTLRGI